MPYIDFEDRKDLDEGQAPSTVGELNYVITKHVVRFLDKHPSYGELNNAIGVLECAKLEFYRRLVAPHEDNAKERNGDVYVEED